MSEASPHTRGFIIEAHPDQLEPHAAQYTVPGEQPAYFFSGYNLEDGAYIERNVLGVILGAAACGSISTTDAAGMWNTTSGIYNGPGCIYERDRRAFDKTMAHLEDHAAHRVNALANFAIAGAPLEPLLEETRVLQTFALRFVNDRGPVLCVDRYGLDADFTENGMRPYAYHRSVVHLLGKGSCAARLEAELGTKAYADQYETSVDPATGGVVIRSRRLFVTLGNIGEDGTFLPVVTALNPGYFARQRGMPGALAAIAAGIRRRIGKWGSELRKRRRQQ